jgi:hypothetical protein
MVSLIDTGLSIVQRATLILPQSVGMTMLGVMRHLPSTGLEYGLYLKGKWDPKTVTVAVSPDDFYLPKQKVSTGNVHFDEDPPDPEWNVVIHRHPANFAVFSRLDKESINREFLASVIFIPPWNFPAAVINIPISPGTKLQVEAEVHSEWVSDLSPELARDAKRKISRISDGGSAKREKGIGTLEGTVDTFRRAADALIEREARTADEEEMAEQADLLLGPARPAAAPHTTVRPGVRILGRSGEGPGGPSPSTPPFFPPNNHVTRERLERTMALKDLLVSRPVSTVTPVVSSLAGALKVYFDGLLPAGYVKDYFIDTDIPITQLRRTKFRPLSESQLSVRRFPLMSVKVDLSVDSSEFADPSTWQTGNAFLADPMKLLPMLRDDISHRYIGFSTDRILTRFQVSFTTETDLKAREIAIFLRRALPISYRVFLTGVVVTSEVPPEILRKIWADKGLGDGSDPAHWEEFHRYLRAFTGGHVERLVDASTGRNAYFFDFVTNPMMVVQGVPSVSVSRDGNVVRSAQVDIQLELDASVPMTYAYRQQADLAPDAPIPEIGSGPDGSVFFGYSVLARPPANVDERRMLCYFNSFVTPDLQESDVVSPRLPDVTDFSAFIGDDLKEFVASFDVADRGDALAVRLWTENAECDQAGYSFDWDSWELTILPDGLLYNHKYNVGLYVDLNDLRALENYPRPQAPRPYY